MTTVASKRGSQKDTPALSCFVGLENAQDIFSGNIWPHLVDEKKLRVRHLEKKEVADLENKLQTGDQTSVF